MADLKTKPTNQSVETFIDTIEPEWKRDDSRELLSLMENITNEKPVMWGDSIVGFGSYHYKYDSGREGDWMLAGFSPRKANLTIYIMGGFDKQEELLGKLGKHKNSVGCLYIKKVEDVDVSVLEAIIRKSVEIIKNRYAKYN